MFGAPLATIVENRMINWPIFASQFDTRADFNITDFRSCPNTCALEEFNGGYRHAVPMATWSENSGQ